jgi:hypothetical protein
VLTFRPGLTCSLFDRSRQRCNGSQRATHVIGELLACRTDAADNRRRTAVVAPRLAVDLVRGHMHRCRRRLRPWCWPRRRPASRDIPFCLIGVQGVPVQDAIAEAELTELFEVFSSINEAWKGLDKREVSTVLNTTVDTGSKRVFTWGSSSRNHAPNDCHSLANRSFSGSRSARWRCWGQRAAGRPRFPGSVSGRGSTTDGHSVR